MKFSTLCSPSSSEESRSLSSSEDMSSLRPKATAKSPKLLASPFTRCRWFTLFTRHRNTLALSTTCQDFCRGAALLGLSCSFPCRGSCNKSFASVRFATCLNYRVFWRQRSPTDVSGDLYHFHQLLTRLMSSEKKTISILSN